MTDRSVARGITAGYDLLNHGVCPTMPSDIWQSVIANTDDGQETPSRTRYRCKEHRGQPIEEHSECTKCTPWFSTYEDFANPARAEYVKALAEQR